MTKPNEFATEDAVVTSALLDLGRAASDAGVRWAIVGGQALQTYGVPRHTIDLDVLVSADEAESVAGLLVDRYHWVPLTSGGHSCSRYAEADDVTVLTMDDPVLYDVQVQRHMIALKTPLGLLVEVLFVQHPVEEEMVEAAVFKVHRGVQVPVAPLGGVLLVKVKADRTKDVAAVQQAAEHLPGGDLRRAVSWAMERDRGTAEDLRNIIDEVKERTTPVRAMRRRRSEK